MKTRFYSSVFLVILCFILVGDLCLAQEAAQPEVSFGERMMRMLPMFIMVFFIFYFLVIRPQNKQELEKKSMLESLKKGDQLVTTGGILGKYASVDDGYVVLDVGSSTKLKVEAAHIAKRIEKKPSEKKDKKKS